MEKLKSPGWPGPVWFGLLSRNKALQLVMVPITHAQHTHILMVAPVSNTDANL